MQLSKQQLLFAALCIGVIVFVIAFSVNKQALAPAPESATNTPALPEAASPVVTTPEPTPQAPAKTAAKSLSTVTPTAKAPAPLTGRIAPDFVRPAGFLNSDTLGIPNTNEFALKDFIGKKIILVNFWTSSSLNSLRVFPYLNQWNNKYKSSGLLIVSIHTPRFTLERSQSFVQKTVFANNVVHPVVLDTGFETWNAYKNSVWPHQYLIDLNGRIVYDHAGEGAYEGIEAKIQSLLAARAEQIGQKYAYQTFKEPNDAYDVDLAKIGSPETYAGAGRNQTLGNGVPRKEGSQSFDVPTTILSNKLYFGGNWNFSKDYAQSMGENSHMIYRYTAKRVYAFLGANGVVRAKVLLDGKPLDVASAGKDIRFEKDESVMYVSDERMYEVVNNAGGYGEHTIEFLPTAGGLDLYTLTFG